MATAISEAVFDMEPFHAALDEVMALYGDGAGVPERIKARIYKMAAKQCEPGDLVKIDFPGRRVMPGSELEALRRRLAMVRAG